MTMLTADQLITLAQQTKEMALALMTYELANWPLLTAQEHNFLNGRQEELLQKARAFNTQSVLVMAADVEDFMTKIKAVTKRMTATVEGITNAARVVEIASAAVALVVAITTSNGALIKQAVENLTALTLPA